MKKTVAVVGMLILLALQSVSFAEEVVVSTGPTFINGVFNPMKDALQGAGLTVNIVVGGPVDALKNLEDGRAEVAGASVSLGDWLNMAEKGGYQVKDKGVLMPFTVMEEDTIIVVNSANLVASLSKDQLKDIFSGKIDNWKNAGGKDMPIVIVWPKISTGAMQVFSKQIMGGGAVTKDILDVPSISDIPATVASTPEAIGLANAGKLPAQAKIVQAPKISRPLTLLTKGAPSAKVQKLYDFLKGEGQKHIKK